MNGAEAVSFARDPRAGLKILGELAGSERMERYQPFHAARADLLRRAGRVDESRLAYSRAIELTDNAADQGFLQRRRDRLS